MKLTFNVVLVLSLISLAACVASPLSTQISTQTLSPLVISTASIPITVDAEVASPLATPTLATQECSTAGEDPADLAALLEELTLDETTFLTWYCAGAGLGDIRQAYTIYAETGRPIAEIFALFFGGMGWGQIARPADVARPVDLDLLPPDESCMEEHGKHDQAANLAKELGVSTEEVSVWFCRDIGFGEIRNGFVLQRETGVPLEEIMSLFLGGKSWGEIRQELGAAPGDDPTGND